MGEEEMDFRRQEAEVSSDIVELVDTLFEDNNSKVAMLLNGHYVLST